MFGLQRQEFMLGAAVCLFLFTLAPHGRRGRAPTSSLIVADDLDRNLGTLDYMPNLKFDAGGYCRGKLVRGIQRETEEVSGCCKRVQCP
jgi:hypothetical protein